MTQYEISDLKSMVDKLLKQHKYPDNFQDHLIDMGLELYDKVLSDMKIAGKLEPGDNSNVDILYDAFVTSQTRWDFAIAYILEKTGRSIPRCSFLAMFYPIGRMDDIVNIAEMSQPEADIANELKAAMDRAIEHFGVDLFRFVPDNMPQMVSPTEAELEAVQRELNQDTITEIMTLMKDLGGRFYADPKKYHDPNLVEKHRRLVTIIQALSKSQPSEK